MIHDATHDFCTAFQCILSVRSLIATTMMLSYASVVAAEGDESDRSTSARMVVEELSGLGLKLTTEAGSIADRFAFDIQVKTPMRDDGTRHTLGLCIEREPSAMSCIVLYPDNVVCAVLDGNRFYFPARAEQGLDVSEGRTFRVLLPGSDGAFSFSFHQLPVDPKPDNPRSVSRLSLDLSYLCRQFCNADTKMEWGDGEGEILLTKRSQKSRRARIVVNAKADAAGNRIRSISWDARDGHSYAVHNIRTGANVSARNQRLALARVRERDVSIESTTIGLPDLVRRWSAMTAGDALTEPEADLGRRLYQGWTTDILLPKMED